MAGFKLIHVVKTAPGVFQVAHLKKLLPMMENLSVQSDLVFSLNQDDSVSLSMLRGLGVSDLLPLTFTLV